MSAINYNDVLTTLQNAGFLIAHIETNTDKPIRCKVTDENGKKGWYWLRELPLESNEIIIQGKFGIWHGDINNEQKVPFPDGVKRTNNDSEMLRKHIAEQRRIAKSKEKAKHAKAAKIALGKWAALSDKGESGYLVSKKIKAHGLRFTNNDSAVVPMRDSTGKLYGLQFLLNKNNPDHAKRIKAMDGSNKRFWPTGLEKKSHFHILGNINPNGHYIVCEGYASGASCFEALACDVPVVIAFDAGNIDPVLLAMHKAYPLAKALIAADDDYLGKCSSCKKYTEIANTLCRFCGDPHKKINTGVIKAKSASAIYKHVEWVAPIFIDRQGKKRTDFNDLAMDESLQTVAHQLNTALTEFFPSYGITADAVLASGASKHLRMIDVDEAVDRFVQIYGEKSMFFDSCLKIIVPKDSMLDIIPDHAWRQMKLHPNRKMIMIDNIGFDPTEKDKNIVCNLWDGFPTQPSTVGSCEHIIKLLQYLCSDDKNGAELFRWVIRWLAYPLQHHGAKMTTGLIFHGPQGAGKNLFFEVISAIYGKYGFVIDQAALEDQFNDWASAKLFLIANEVVARQELFQLKNRIKGMVSDGQMRIRAPHMPSRWENNHANMVFLSNETQPLVLERSDRRFTVVWTPEKEQHDYYNKVGEEIKNGGVAALYHYLLNVDLDDFNPHTKPPISEARDNLIDLGLETPDRFINAWMSKELDSVPCLTCDFRDLYKIYQAWIKAEGERFAYTASKFSSRIRTMNGLTLVKKHVRNRDGNGTKTCLCVVPDVDPNSDNEVWTTFLRKKIDEFKSIIDENNHAF